MKAKEVLKLLRITRPTLSKYVKNGIIKKVVLPSGRYDYDKKSVYDLLNKGMPRQNVLYVRVSTKKQKQDLENQIETLKNFCNNNGITIQEIYKDVASGINFNRSGLEKLLEDVMNGEIQTVYITYKDRLSRIGFDLFKNLFEKFGTDIVVLNETDDNKIIEKEIFEEIISLIHTFAMKVYSHRRREKLKLIEKDLKLEVKK